MNELQLKSEKLVSRLKELNNVAVAFSAGVDSTFLLQVAHEVLGKNVIAITGKYISFTDRESKEADEFCKKLGIEHVEVEIDQLSIDGFSENSVDRCYICKKKIFSDILEMAENRKIKYVLDGSNSDDALDYRPGAKALEELGIISPLKEAGLNKEEIRVLSKEKGLYTWDKPSLACLATRIPYGEKITEEKLDAIEKAETYLYDLGFKQVRVRMHGKTARIEIERNQFEKILRTETINQVNDFFKTLGFSYITLDLEGYRTGSMNKTIK